jgi:hypothetical protein
MMKWLIKQLRKPRWYTADHKHAEQSPCQWKPYHSGYTLSLLGAINAIATWTGYALVAVDDKRLTIRKAWW